MTETLEHWTENFEISDLILEIKKQDLLEDLRHQIGLDGSK